MTNTDCSDLIPNSQGCMAIARLLVKILDIDVTDRLNEAGKCEICRRPTKYAWSVVDRNTGEEWDVKPGTKKAARLNRDEYDHIKFMVTPTYYCLHALDRWAMLEDAEDEQVTSTYQGKHGQQFKRFLDTRNKVSPIDVALALQVKRKFDAVNTFVRLEPTKSAPMDSLR